MADSLLSQLRARGEEYFTEFSNNLLSNPRFIEMLKKGIAAKEAVDKQVAEALKSMNVATRKDLRSLEHRIDALEAALSELKESLAAKPAPKKAARKRS